MSLSALVILLLAFLEPKLVDCHKSGEIYRNSGEIRSTTNTSTTTRPTTTTKMIDPNNLCDILGNLTFPVCATDNPNLTLTDANYNSEIRWYYRFVVLRGSCFFSSGKLYRCPLPANQTTTACTDDDDCPNYQACYVHNCIDPCQGACVTGANCMVVNHAPNCSCPWGTIGNAFVSCVPGCSNNDGCPSSLACVSSNCTDPCPGATPCSGPTVCEGVNHAATCVPNYCSSQKKTVPEVGTLIVGTTTDTYNNSATYCSNCPGCNLYVPQNTSALLIPILFVPGVLDSNAAYWIGVTFYNGSAKNCIQQDINGKPWNLLSSDESLYFCYGGDTSFYAIAPVFYFSASADTTLLPLCLC